MYSTGGERVSLALALLWRGLAAPRRCLALGSGGAATGGASAARLLLELAYIDLGLHVRLAVGVRGRRQPVVLSVTGGRRRFAAALLDGSRTQCRLDHALRLVGRLVVPVRMSKSPFSILINEMHSELQAHVVNAYMRVKAVLALVSRSLYAWRLTPGNLKLSIDSVRSSRLISHSSSRLITSSTCCMHHTPPVPAS